MEVVAADGAVEVEDFAGEVEIGDELALHGAGIDFVEGDAAGGDFGFFEAEGAGDGDGQAFERVDEALAFGAGEGGSFAVLGQAGLLQQDFAKAAWQLLGEDGDELLFA